jgi:hypothetical protein
LEAAFVLLEFSSPSRRIFIGSHSLPPSLVRRIGPSRVFRMRIQKAIQEGHLKFDNKMKLDGHPFPQNMVGFSVNMVTAEEKGKVKVLTSARAKQDGAVDPERQVTLEQVHGEAPRVLKSHVEIGESSRAKPRVTTRILLNKWQRQLEKERYQK